MTQIADVFGTIASITVVVMLLGPAPSVMQIHRTKSTGVTPLAPLVSMFTNGWLWVIYGILTDNIFPVAVCNFVAVVLATLYTTVYYRHTTERAYARKLIGIFLLPVVLATVYALVGALGHTNQSRAEVGDVFGYLGNVTVFIFFAAPFENLSLVFKHRSAVFIPIFLIVVGAINSAVWCVYSLLDVDWFIFVPNFGALLLGTTQIVICLIFHPKTHPYTPPADGVDVGIELASESIKSLHPSPVFTAVHSPST